jgi:hypothetical protein
VVFHVITVLHRLCTAGYNSTLSYPSFHTRGCQSTQSHREVHCRIKLVALLLSS